MENESLKNENEFESEIIKLNAKIKELEKRTTQENWLRFFKNYGYPATLLDLNYKVIEVNDAILHVTGKTRNQIIGECCYDLYYGGKEICKLENCPIKILSEKKQPFIEVELEAFGKIYVATCIPVFNDAGALTNVTHIVKDISEDKKIISALKDSKRQLQYAFKATSDGIWEWNLLTNETYYSARWYEMLGYEDNELPMILSTWKDFCHPEDFPQTMDVIQHYIQHPSVKGFEVSFRMKKKDGRWLWILGRGNVVEYDEAGKPVFMSGTNTDITERKLAEILLNEKAEEIQAQNEELSALNEEITESYDMLSKSEEQHRLLINHMQLGLALHEIICNDKGEVVDYRFIDINPAYERLVGLKREGTVGRTVTEVLPGIEKYWIENFGKVALTGEVLHYENYVEVLKKYYETIAYRPAPNQFAVIVSDITERKEIENVLKEKSDALEAQNEEYLQLNEELMQLNEELSITKKIIEEKEKNYRDIFNSSSDAIFIQNAITGEVIDVNSTMLKMYGYSSKDEVINKPISFFSAPESEYSDEKAALEIGKVRQNEIVNTEWKARRKDGSLFWVDVVLTPSEIGGAEFVLASVRNTQDKKEAAQKIKQSEERWQFALEGPGDGVWDWNMKTDDVFYSKTWKSMLGYNENEINPTLDEWREKVHPQDLQMCYDEIEKHISGITDIYKTEHRMLCKNGTYKWILNRGKIIERDENGKPARMIGIHTDITLQKEAEEKIRISEEKYKSVVSNTEVVTFIIDVNGIFQMSEGKGLEKLGLKPGQVVGLSAFDVYKDFPTVISSINKVIAGEHIRHEFKIFDVVFDTLYTPVYDNQGNVTLVIGLAIDITDRKNAEMLLQEKTDEIEAQNEEYRQINEELQLAKEKAEESDHLKSAFLANLSHEIRTPMNGILGFANLLKEPDLDSDKRDMYIDVIHKSGRHLLSVITDIIEISKIETGQVKPNFSNVNVSKLLEDLYKTISITIPENKDLQLVCKKEDVALNIVTDEVKLLQVLTNLVTNAIKFTEQGVVSFGVEVKDRTLQFRVSDTGIGIDPKYHHVIFDRFRQVEGDFAIKQGGSGLGLAISKAYLEMLGGDIYVESSLGAGSSFIFTIPYQKPFEKPIELEQTVSKPRVEPEDSKGVILIAEDDEINYLFLVELLKQLKYRNIRAENGVQAVDLCTFNPNINMVLMDLKMPEMNGYQATAEIKKIRPNLPIIAQTAYALSDDEKKAKEAGCDAYVSKPIAKEKLIELIKKFL